MKYIKPTLFIARCFSILGLLIGLMILIAGCPAPPKRGDMIDSDADFVGFITGIQPAGSKGILGLILVESHADKLVDKFIITLTSDAQIFKRDGENHNPAGFDILEVGQQVQVWFADPIKDSFPAQATAQQVVIVKRY